MVLEIGGGLFGQSDVREAVESIANKNFFAKATWTATFTTASGSYVDVTGATVTLSGLSATKTYTFVAWCAITTDTNTSGAENRFKLVIGSTDVCINATEVDAANEFNPVSVHGALTGQTGVTSITAKLQALTGAGTLEVPPTGSALIQSIMVQAIEE